MKKYKYPFHSIIEIQFKNKNEAELVYHSLYPDIRRTSSKYFKVNMHIEDNLIRFTIFADSIGKFRGVYKTILRLLNILNQFSLNEIEG